MSQLSDVCEKLKIKAKAEYSSKPLPEGWGDPQASAWKVRLTFEKRSLTVDFFTGSAHRDAPNAADVLSCLCSDVSCGEESFEDFCSSLGYDSDSRKAEKTWKACSRMAPKVRKFLGEHFDEVSSAEH